MKPIEYFVQTPAIDSLIAEYGQHLKDMDRDDRNCLIACLALKYSQSRAWPGANPPSLYEVSDYMDPDLDRTSDEFESICERLDGLTIGECFSLIHALTQQEIERE